MAWPKKIKSMTIEPAKNGILSTVRPAGDKRNPYPDSGPPTIHPTVGHLQAHIGKLFGAPKASKASSLAAGTPRSATNAGGGRVSLSPAQGRIASSMLGGS